MMDLPDQPSEWRVVFEEVQTLDDGLALYDLIEDSDTLYANDLPLYAIQFRAHEEVPLLSSRGSAEWVGELVGAGFRDIYRPLRSTEPTADATESLRARCRARGVELTDRPSPPPPWKVVAAQVASEQDAAAYRAVVDDYCANNVWFDRNESPMPGEPAHAATPEELAGFIARCRAAGVVLRR